MVVGSELVRQAEAELHLVASGRHNLTSQLDAAPCTERRPSPSEAKRGSRWGTTQLARASSSESRRKASRARA
jgi:hypothetical protein